MCQAKKPAPATPRIPRPTITATTSRMTLRALPPCFVGEAETGSVEDVAAGTVPDVSTVTPHLLQNLAPGARVAPHELQNAINYLTKVSSERTARVYRRLMVIWPTNSTPASHSRTW